MRDSEWFDYAEEEWEEISPTSGLRRSNSTAVLRSCYEHETKVFGEWTWGGLMKNHWEACSAMDREALAQDTIEPDLPPSEVIYMLDHDSLPCARVDAWMCANELGVSVQGMVWDSEWVAGEWESIRGLVTRRKRKWVRREVKCQ